MRPEIRIPTPPLFGSAALLAAACLFAPLHAGESRSGTAAREQARREAAIEEAQELLEKGDQAYTNHRYADAVEAYAGARERLPEAPVTAELRDAATQRYAQASVEAARVLARNGDVAAAKTTVDKVLAEGVAPGDPGALAFRAQLDDPIRTNPALTAEHAKNVDEVRRLLYTAQGAFDLGKLDEATAKYTDVLRIDPTNTAARRGLEKVAGAKSGYQQSAYDHARAELLSQVDQQWELPVPPAADLKITNRDNFGTDPNFVSVRNKIDRITIPRVDLDQASLEEAIDFMRLRSRENDQIDHTGVNIAVNLGPPDSPAATKIRAIRFDLRVANLPLGQVLKYIADLTQTSYTTDEFAVIFTAAGSTSEELVLRTYRVPPDFLTTINSGLAAPSAAPDPFAEAPAGGILPQRLGVQEALTKQGVTFPQGATASYIAASNTLRIYNTDANQSVISQIIDSLARTEPVLVSVAVTLLRVEQNNLKEIGFDWLLDNFGFGGGGSVGGSSELNLSGGTVGNGNNLDDITLPPGTSIRNPITAGNRSGDFAISNNAIDDLIRFPRGRQESNRAPGTFGVRGDISNATVQALMRGLDQKKGTDIMARPSIVTRSGQSSSVQILREFIYPTEYEPPELPNSTGGDIFGLGGGGAQPVTPATPTAFDTKELGIALEVLPVVDPDKNYVTVTLSPSFSDFDGFVNYGSPINTTRTSLLGDVETVAITDNTILQPVFSKQSFSSNLDVADGATIVAGGLLQESVQNVEDKTPILGSIPIVGRLFQSKARQSTSTALLFLLHVEIMDPTGRSYRDR